MKKILFAAALAGAAILTSCGGSKGGVQMGSLSEFDSLSYALGANIGNGINMEMKDVPFDYEILTKAIQESAQGKATQEHDKSIEMLREYFMTKRGERAQAIAMEYAKEDSVRMAGGDSTKVERPAANAKMFESEQERADISYAFGNDIGFNIANSGMPIQLVWIAESMANVRDKTAKMTEDAVNQYLQYYFMVKRPAENAAASKAWLEKMAKKSGAKTTESGIVYKIHEAGDQSVMAKDSRDVVKVHYTGRNREGKVFDTSKFENRSKEQQDMMRKQNPEAFDEKGNLKEGNKEVEFPLNRVIPGWTEGLKLVGKGGKITIWIPSELAYGERGSGRDIAPNEALEFEVELIDVVPYVEPAPAVPADTTAAVAITPATK